MYSIQEEKDISPEIKLKDIIEKESKVTHTLEYITPGLAKEYLKRNNNNRPQSSNWAHKLKERILNGEWGINGETIKFDTDGNLIDGQHRLMAVVLADSSIESFVIRGLPSTAFGTIDDGKKRSGGDVLAVKGEKHYKLLAAILNLLGYYYSIGRPDPHKRSFSNKDILVLLDRYPDARISAKFSMGIYRRMDFISTSINGFCHYLFTKVSSQDEAENFLSNLASGANLEENSPILKLRDKLKYERQIQRLKYDNNYWAHLMIKAWNMYRKGEKCRYLKINFDNDEHKDFPAPI